MTHNSKDGMGAASDFLFTDDVSLQVHGAFEPRTCYAPYHASLPCYRYTTPWSPNPDPNPNPNQVFMDHLERLAVQS